MSAHCGSVSVVDATYLGRTIASEDDDQVRFSRFRGAALASVSAWSELMSITPIGDQANTLCVFAVEPGPSARDRLLATLRADAPPLLDDVVKADEDIFAVITHEDEGLGLSSLLLVGRARLRRCFARQAALLENRVDNYLAETSAAETHED